MALHPHRRAWCCSGVVIVGASLPPWVTCLTAPPSSCLCTRPFTYPEGFFYSLVPERAVAFEKPEGLLEVTGAPHPQQACTD